MDQHAIVPFYWSAFMFNSQNAPGREILPIWKSQKIIYFLSNIKNEAV